MSKPTRYTKSAVLEVNEKLGPEYRFREPFYRPYPKLEKRVRRRFLWWTWWRWEEVGFAANCHCPAASRGFIVHDEQVAEDVSARGIDVFLSDRS